MATIHDDSLRRLFGSNLGDNFGVEYHEGFSTWEPTSRRCSEEFLNGLEGVLAFDAAVMNGDRKASNSNLLCRSENYYLIDHSLALPVKGWPNGTSQQ